MTDLYNVLGLPRTATAEDVRAAYRRLAKQYHPDLNGGNPAAVDRFKQVTAAYDILGDKDRRARYDRGEIDATGAEKPRFEHAFHGGGPGGFGGFHSGSGGGRFRDIGDMFADMLGAGFAEGAAGSRRAQHGPGARRTGAAVGRGEDVRLDLAVGFVEAAKGVRKRVTLPDGGALDLSVPAGVADGQVLRLRGKGRPGRAGMPPGDAHVTIRVLPHPLFERRGDDILLDLPVSLAEAVLGARIEVPTIWGPVTMTVPRGAGGGTTLRLKGKGIEGAKGGGGGGRGDQLVRLRIVLPDRPDAELEALVRDWSARHPHDPRSGGDWATD